jgi:uncharacterized protein (DUF427 family)
MSDAATTARRVLIPGPDHPITVTPHSGRVVVRAGDKVIADTRAALSLKEASYPAVLYIPRADADLTALDRSDHHTYCPYKGEASYYSIPEVNRGENAIWTYENPYDAVASIEGHLAFYADRVTITESAV